MADFRRHIPTIIATSAFWILVFGAAFLFGLRRPPAQPIEILPPPTIGVKNSAPEPTATTAPLRVYVSGAVRAQGVYRLSPNSLVEDAISEAGGANEDADLIAINLAHPLSDGEQIYVPVRGEESPPPPLADKDAADSSRTKTFDLPDEPIDLNTATAAELESLPGVGPKTAALLIQERPYSSVEDLLRVKGIGEKTLEKLHPYIKVD
ncbi:MAG TPA: ComEA family DNA-binding protein [Caldilineae bacterium]|nr:ComEA family DNA-binding protein [Caldilineae bacterium]